MIEQFTPGQRVTLAHDDGTVLVGTVARNGHTIDIAALDTFARLDSWEGKGFRVTHIDGEPVPAAPTLPTEEGVYLDREDQVWEAGEDGVLVYGVDPSEKPEDWAPFRRLVPQGENRAAIAREVIDWIDNDFGDQGAELDILAAREHFGVTEQGS